MSDQLQTLREDLGFIRAVAEDTGPPFQRDGLILVAAGLLWGLPAIAGWAYLRGFLDVPVSLMRATLYLPAPLMLIATLYLIRRFPRGTAGVTSRAMSAAWAGLGWSAAAGVAGRVLPTENAAGMASHHDSRLCAVWLGVVGGVRRETTRVLRCDCSGLLGNDGPHRSARGYS